MFILSNILIALAPVLSQFFNLYSIVLLIRILLTWVNPDPYNPLVRALSAVTDPVLDWVREKVPLNFGGLDLSPILVFMVLQFLERFSYSVLNDIAGYLRTMNL